VGNAIATDATVLRARQTAETQGVQGFPGIFIGEARWRLVVFPGSVISQNLPSPTIVSTLRQNQQVARFDSVYQQAVSNHR